MAARNSVANAGLAQHKATSRRTSSQFSTSQSTASYASTRRSSHARSRLVGWRQLSNSLFPHTPSPAQTSAGLTTMVPQRTPEEQEQSDDDIVASVENRDSDGDEEGYVAPEDRPAYLPKRTPVFPILQLIRNDIKTTIDTGLSWDELTGHELNFVIVRPLAVKLGKLKSPAILYIMLLTRIHFLREAERDLGLQNINQTRADLCEILAIKLLRTFGADSGELVTAVSSPFSPLTGADEHVHDRAERSGYNPTQFTANHQSSSALQLAIYSQAKKFVSNPLVQKCVNGIWNGQIVLGNSSAGRGAIIEDSYKKRPVSFYDPRTAPFLDYHRLRVPRVRSFLEAVNFAFILVFYILCLGSKGSPTWTVPETLYTVWITGLALDELAQFREHTASVYFGSLFNVLDTLFCLVGFCWLGFRISGLITNSPAQSDFSFDILSLGAILLCPRLASLLISDNVLMLALRAMVVEFGYFFGLALVFFSGFLWTFWSLADSPKWTRTRISWLMLRFTFGNTISFEEAQQFSLTFGPILVVAFTILSQTLLLTVLISLLSATFARVAEHAQEESLFQHTFATLQGASSEALFSYFPPLNILCILTVLPASFTLSPRWLHKLNVFIIRTTHLPILLAIRAVQQPQWGRAIELTAEKTGPVLSRWRWRPKRGHPDLLEIVFGEMSDKAPSPSEFSHQLPAARPLSKSYSRRSVVGPIDTHAEEHGFQSPGFPESTTPVASGPTRPIPSIRTDLDRVQWADETYDLPASPGATIRQAKASLTGSGGVSAFALARRDTFKDLAHQLSRKGKKKGKNTPAPANKDEEQDAKEEPDTDDGSDGDEDEDEDEEADDKDSSHVVIPVELVDPGVAVDSSEQTDGLKRSPALKNQKGRTGKASNTSLVSHRPSSRSPLSRVLSSSRHALSSKSAAAPTMTRAHTVEGSGDSSQSGSIVAGSSSNKNPFSAYKAYRSGRGALLGRRRSSTGGDVSPHTQVHNDEEGYPGLTSIDGGVSPLTAVRGDQGGMPRLLSKDLNVSPLTGAGNEARGDEVSPRTTVAGDQPLYPGGARKGEQVSPRTKVADESQGRVSSDSNISPRTKVNDDQTEGQGRTLSDPGVSPRARGKQRDAGDVIEGEAALKGWEDAEGDEDDGEETENVVHFKEPPDDAVEIMPVSASRKKRRNDNESMGTVDSGALVSAARLLHRKDTFDVDAYNDIDQTSTDTAIEQREAGASSVSVIREVMLSFLERLDEQSMSVERIERMLNNLSRRDDDH
ncbi:unnamed protein product [Sympodiomycopsis kandeliae]